MRLEAVHAGFQVPQEVLCPLALVQQHSLQLPIAGLHRDSVVDVCAAAPSLAEGSSRTGSRQRVILQCGAAAAQPLALNAGLHR